MPDAARRMPLVASSAAAAAESLTKRLSLLILCAAAAATWGEQAQERYNCTMSVPVCELVCVGVSAVVCSCVYFVLFIIQL